MLIAVPPTPAPQCASEQLALRFGPRPSPVTGEHAYAMRLANRSGRACSLYGYPGVRLGAGDRTLRFGYRWGGSENYPGTGIAAKWISVYPPGGASPLVRRLTPRRATAPLVLCAPPAKAVVNLTFVGPVYRAGRLIGG